MAALMPQGKQQYFTAGGIPLVGGKVYTYAAGTTTPLATYTTAAASTPNANPVILDSRGEASIFFSAANYKIVVKDSLDSTIWTQDNLPGDAAASVLASLALSTGSSLVGYIQTGAGVVATTAQERDRRELWVQDFMSASEKTDGFGTPAVIDSTTAFNYAIAAAVALGNSVVHLQSGRDYKITDELTITQGIMLVAQGTQGSTQASGCSITHYSNGNLFVWNGNGTANKGTGGGLKNVLLLKAATYAGGDALKLLATDDSHRPGEMVFENVLGYGLSGAMWARGLHVDGSACTTSGSKGVRSIKLSKVRFADCSTNNQYIYLNQAVHVVSDYLQLDQGSGTGTCGMTVTGDSDNLILGGLILNGNLIINGSSAMNVVLTGRVGVLDVNNTLVLGTANIQCTALNNAALNFRITSNITDAFMAVMASTVSNVTGDGTSYNVNFDTEVFDVAGGFGGDTYSAFCAGRYIFTWCVGYTGLLNTHTRHDTGIVQKRSGSTIQEITKVSNPYAQGSNGGLNYSESGSAELLLEEGDTVNLVANVSGGTKVVDILGASTRYTWWSGHYIP